MTADELKQGLLDSMLRIAERFGVPVVLLGVVIWLGREAAITLHGSLVEPVVKAHVEFLDATSETLREISSVQTKQAQTLDEVNTIVKTLAGGRSVGERSVETKATQPNAAQEN